MYRKKEGKIEILLGHPGGPYHVKRDLGSWSFPKGLVEEGEDLFETAKREFVEETGTTLEKIEEKDYFFVGVGKRVGKEVHIWAFEGDMDSTKIKSNICKVEWPPQSGKQIEIPEVDRADFFSIEEAKAKISPYLVSVIEEFEKIIAES